MDKVMSSFFSGLMVGICLSESCFVEGEDEEVENEDGKGVFGFVRAGFGRSSGSDDVL
jgi:hypothetical protein